MKNIKTFLLSLVSLFLIASCSTVKPNEESPTIIEKTNSVNVVLNLTSIGLYEGKKGEANPQYFLENTVSLSLQVGDKLPGKSTITSTSEDVEFANWVYYDKGGILSSTDAVVEGILQYQAHFEYVGEFENDGGNSGGNDVSTDKIYFMDATWWNKDGATSSFYAWGGSASYSYPGVVMQLEETLSNNRKVWSISVDVSSFTGFMFARTSSNAAAGSTATDWGAKTADLSPSLLGSNNLVILNGGEAWGVGVAVKYATYVPGKTNY